MVSFHPRLATGRRGGLVGRALAAGLPWMLLLCGAGRVPAADALDQWIAAQVGMKAWSADFRQTRSLAVLKEPLISQGRVWFAVPNLFRWELGEPPQTVAVRGTNEIAVLYPRLKRADRIPLAVARGPLREALSLLEAGFPRSRAEIEERFLVRSLTEFAPPSWRVVLQPRSAEARRLIESVTLEFAVPEAGPRATELRFADGTTLRNDFTRAVADPELAADWFAVVIPAGFKVNTMP